MGERDEQTDERARLRAALRSNEAPEIIGTAVAFHYINRMVSVFLPESPFVGPRVLRSLIARNASVVMGDFQNDLDPRVAFVDVGGDLPVDLAWAAGSETVAKGMLAMACVTEALGAQYVPEAIRAMLEVGLRDWNGEAPRPGSTWLDDAVAQLPAEARAIGRLSFLTAHAPYRVDERVVRAVHGPASTDTRLLTDAGCWASPRGQRSLQQGQLSQHLGAGAISSRSPARSVTA